MSEIFLGDKNLGPSGFREAIRKNSEMEITDVSVFIKGGIATVIAKTKNNGILRCEITASTKLKALLIVQLHDDWYFGEELIMTKEDKIAKHFGDRLAENQVKVVVSRDGKFHGYGGKVGLNEVDDGDNKANCLCIGAQQIHEGCDIFVVFREEGSDIVDVLKYEGKRLFPDPVTPVSDVNYQNF